MPGAVLTMLGVVGSRSILALNWPMKTPQVLGVLVMRRTPNIQTTMGPWNGSTDIIPRKSTSCRSKSRSAASPIAEVAARTRLTKKLT
jgi:hypothetical protein